MIITAAWTAFFAILAGLGIGDPWTAVIAILLGTLLVIALGGPEMREIAILLGRLFLAGFGIGRRSAAAAHGRAMAARDGQPPAIPGPGKPQASGVSRDADTAIEGWTPAQMAFIRGDTDELPGTSTLPNPADIPEENPS